MKKIAEDFCRFVVVPSMVDHWSKAATRAPGKPVETPEASPATQAAPEPESGPAAPPAQHGGAVEASPTTAAEPTSDLPDGKAPEAVKVPAAQPPVVVGREQVLAAFARSRIPPPPATPQPRPVQRQAEPADRDFSEEAWDEFCVGFRFNTLKSNVRRLGPEPGNPDCRAPKEVLRRNGLL